MRDIAIGGRQLASGRPYLIAEAGVNHNGDVSLAIEMVDAAADCGVDAVKFQLFDAHDLARRDAPSAAYQGQQIAQYQLLDSLRLDRADLIRLAGRARERGLEFLCTPFSVDGLRFLVDELDVAAIKVSSGDLTYSTLLRAAAATRLPVLLSTGMATLDEARRAVHDLDGSPAILLQCVTQYPAPTEHANLRALDTLRSLTGDPVGYSDHTASIAPSIVAVALGARVIERHFTLDVDLPGPDHRASLDPEDLAAWVSSVTDAHAALGDGMKVPQASETETRVVARRALVPVRKLDAGTVIQEDDLIALRPADGIGPEDIDAVVGRTLRNAVTPHAALQWHDLA